ncbi:MULTISPECIES: PEP-CTERM sorting domain-containing protein [Neptunomonas]|uniref:PEP-CTERM protein-sorting domain-containing protein n=1 Tax=Neptunomonas qingdaonensis TaxID=1045558 RepID=A0A1I2S547_9GAMM|nr:PEP-CTERM sorting domain-containing protein [Neptunomonas qingdaonensis]SFG47982.1 PEP-CTERM protein-sorting domain-containing protein [Neptunomonas qingdaonensis]
MKNKLLLTAAMVSTSFPTLASAPTSVIPEPSTLGLFAAAAIAITIVAKFKK